MIVVDIYGRVSTQEQAEEGYSIGEQEARLTKFCEAQGWVINRVCMDGGFTGAKLERPALRQVIEDAQNRRINKVVVYKLDRLSRSQKDTLYLIEDVFRENGVDFVSMTESLDTSTPFGMAMIGILSVFAQLERETIKERMTIGRDARVKEGKYRGSGRKPIGYIYADGQLHIDEYEADIVRGVFDDYLNGISMSQIAKHLNALKLRGSSWTTTTVRRTLSLPLYIGRQRYKGEEYIVTDCPHIIDEPVWYAVQNKLARFAAPVQPQSQHDHTTLLGGIIWCGCCGHRYAGYLDKDANGNKFRRYYCYGRMLHSRNRSDEKCANRSWRADELDDIILAELRKISVTGDYTQHQTNDIAKQENAVISRITACKNKIDRLIDLYAVGTLSADKIAAKSSEYNAELEALENQLQAIRNPVGLNADEVNIRLSSFAELVDTAPKMELYNIVHQLIQSVTLNGDNVIIQWNF